MPVPLAAVVLACLVARPDPAALVRDLGSPAFAVREKASRELWKLGPDAKAALEAAASGSDDAEVRQRAAAILERFAWGVFPDTPPAVHAQIRLFRTGEIDKQD